MLDKKGFDLWADGYDETVGISNKENTYALHHLTDEQKVTFLHTLRDCLKENGLIVIGDIAFETRDKLNRCRREVGDAWDDEEIYFVFDELRTAFPRLAFTQISYCAGILTLAR